MRKNKILNHERVWKVYHWCKNDFVFLVIGIKMIHLEFWFLFTLFQLSLNCVWNLYLYLCIWNFLANPVIALMKLSHFLLNPYLQQPMKKKILSRTCEAVMSIYQGTSCNGQHVVTCRSCTKKPSFLSSSSSWSVARLTCKVQLYLLNCTDKAQDMEVGSL